MKILHVGGKELRAEGDWVEIPKEKFQRWINSIRLLPSGTRTWWENIKGDVRQVLFRKGWGLFGQPAPQRMLVTDSQVWRLCMLTPQKIYDIEKGLIPW